jgi:dTDP-glucose 4,6-dehydratase
LAYIKTNIEGSYNIFQAARKLDITRVIHTSTSEVYGTAQYIPINENHPINPTISLCSY